MAIEEFTVRKVCNIGVLGDTHITTRFSSLPQEIFDHFQGVDLIIHVGDVVEISVIHDLRELSEVIAVRGNMDRLSITEEFPLKCIINVNNFRIGVIHGHGCSPAKLHKHLFEEFKDANVDCILFGHTHHPENVVEDGVLLFNPGSPNDNVELPYGTLGVLDVGDKKEGGNIVGQIIKLGDVE